MRFSSIDLEDELPDNPRKIRDSSEFGYYHGSRGTEKKPDKQVITELIESNYGGIARYVIQMWFRTNELEIELLELLVGTGDETISAQQYIYWCRELLALDSKNESGLEMLLHYESMEKNLHMEKEISNELLSLYPNNSKGNMHKIEELVASGDFEMALNSCNKILEKDKKNRFALRQRAIIYTHMKSFSEASFFWSEWIEAGWASVDDKFRAARAHYNSKHFSECVSILDEIIEEFSDKEKILDLIIRSRYSLYHWERCHEECEKILEINSRNSTGLKYMRLTKARLGTKMAIMPTITFESTNEKEEDSLLMWFEYI